MIALPLTQPLENLKVELEITGFYSQSDNYFISFIFNLEDYPHFLVGFWLEYFPF